jgi:DnaK suppressor protein
MTNFNDLQAQLKKERENVTAELDQFQAEKNSADENREGSPFGKREESASELFEWEKTIALEKQLSDYLTEIDHALEKFDSGTYGICEQCGKPIEPARLEALPHATLCLTCKSMQDKKNRVAR